MFDKLGTWNWELIAPVPVLRQAQGPSVPIHRDVSRDGAYPSNEYTDNDCPVSHPINQAFPCRFRLFNGA